jgi:membrane protein YdbS with pleckstrin-like domain
MNNTDWPEIPQQDPNQPSQLSMNLAIITLTSFVMFVILKVGGIIDWSWWWVTSPLWIAVILNILAVLGIYLSFMVLKRLVVKIQKDLEKQKEDNK